MLCVCSHPLHSGLVIAVDVLCYLQGAAMTTRDEGRPQYACRHGLSCMIDLQENLWFQCLHPAARSIQVSPGQVAINYSYPL